MHAYDVGSTKYRSSDCRRCGPIALRGRHRAANRLGEERLSRGANEQWPTELRKRAQTGEDFVAVYGLLGKAQPGIDDEVVGLNPGGSRKCEALTQLVEDLANHNVIRGLLIHLP